MIEGIVQYSTTLLGFYSATCSETGVCVRSAWSFMSSMNKSFKLTIRNAKWRPSRLGEGCGPP